eukprot:Gb_32002 [translate_table: standard]
MVGASVISDRFGCKNGRFLSSMAPCLETQMNLCQKAHFADSERRQLYKYLEACCNSSSLAQKDHPSGTDRNSCTEFQDGFFCEENDDLWSKMQAEARRDAESEPLLASFLYSTILAHKSLEMALAFHLSNRISTSTLPSTLLYTVIEGILMEETEIQEAIRTDIKAVKEKDPACISYIHCMLYFKGFLACQAHRVAHSLWNRGRVPLALAIQNRVSEVFAIDIHPGARIGKGVLFDHATGVVVGETAVIGDNVSILHNVTLGGTGKHEGDRHPKIGDGVLIGAGTNILGNINIGEGAKVGAGSVVLTEVPPYTTAVGNPARLIGGKRNPSKFQKVASSTMDHTSYITEWSDYVI